MSNLIAKTAMDRRVLDIVRTMVEGLGFDIVRVRLMGGGGENVAAYGRGNVHTRRAY